MHRATFEFILDIISNYLIREIKGCPTIPPRQQFLITLWKMATMDSYRYDGFHATFRTLNVQLNLLSVIICRSICDRFNVGRATALRAVRRVTRALFTIAPQFVSWPSNEDAQIIMHKFEEVSGFPNTIDAIDGTHIRIEAPKENAVDYINRKGYHSIQLQVNY